MSYPAGAVNSTVSSAATTCGTKPLLPVIVMSAFPEEDLPWGGWSIIVAVAIGVGLFLLYLGIQKAIINMRLNRLNSSNPGARDYVEKVLAFDE